MSSGAQHNPPGAAMLHPIAWSALVLLLLNDHYLKQTFGNALTGKLSDVAGLIVFPLFVVGVCEWLDSRRASDARPLAGAWPFWLTGVVFAAMQLLTPAAEGFRYGLGLLQWPYYCAKALLLAAPWPPIRPVAHTADPTDLFALPALGVAYWVWRRSRIKAA